MPRADVVDAPKDHVTGDNNLHPDFSMYNEELT
jgi:hypothetical protein